MALQIVSCKRKTGTFEGKQYDNFNLVCADYLSTNATLIFGPDMEELKIKRDDFLTALGRNFAALGDKYNGAKVHVLEGMLISPIYNKFGQCVDFTLAEDVVPSEKVDSPLAVDASSPKKVATGK